MRALSAELASDSQVVAGQTTSQNATQMAKANTMPAVAWLSSACLQERGRAAYKRIHIFQWNTSRTPRFIERVELAPLKGVDGSSTYKLRKCYNKND